MFRAGSLDEPLTEAYTPPSSSRRPDALPCAENLTLRKVNKMTVGPIQMIVLGFDSFEPTGKVLPALKRATRSGAVRLHGVG